MIADEDIVVDNGNGTFSVLVPAGTEIPDDVDVSTAVEVGTANLTQAEAEPAAEEATEPAADPKE